MEDMECWFENLTREGDYNLCNDLLIIQHGSTPIGVGGFVRIDWRNRKAEVSFYVGEGYARTEEVISEALLAVVDYGSKTLNLRKMSFPVYQGNSHLPTYEKILQREYVAKAEYYWDGGYRDRIILVAYNE
jgi:RimJ/RimL family protein N-acetyltransferase